MAMNFLTINHKTMRLDYTVQDLAYVYKKLRIIKREGLIRSRRDTGGIRPAKRISNITPRRIGYPTSWEEPLEKLKSSLEAFLKTYLRSKK